MSLDTSYEFGDPPQQIEHSSGWCRRRLKDGEIHLYDKVAWCFQCRSFQAAEELPTVVALKERLRSLKQQHKNRRREQAEAKRVMDPSLKLDAQVLRCGQLDVDSVEKQLEVAKAELAWRKRRRSPPRCLRCGSTEIQYICPGGKPMPHPEGLGIIRLFGQSISTYIRELVDGSDDEEISSLQPKVPEWVFDAEGLRLGAPYEGVLVS